MQFASLFGRLLPREGDRFAGLDKTWILSAGRTGTRFFGEKLGPLLPGLLSVHEPDRVDPGLWKETLFKLRQQGPRRLVLGKALGLFGTRNLSLSRIRGRLSRDVALDRLLLERRWVLEGNPRAYLESNPQLFGLGPDLLDLPRSWVVVLVRDPRSWLPSWMGKRWFAPNDWVERLGVLGLQRLNPTMLGQESDWARWTPLQKLAWTWNDMNARLLRLFKDRPKDCRLYRFEDLFEDRDKKTLDEFLDFVSWGRADEQTREALGRAFGEKINVREAEGPRLYENWSAEEKNFLKSVCGKLAEELGYRLD